MNCPTCGRENRRGANYCRFCGAHFALACSHCRTVLPEDAEFCDNCGRRVAEERAALGLAGGQAAAPAPRPAVEPAQPAPQPWPAQPRAQAAAQPQAESQPSARIPAELQRKLETARLRGEMVGERRIVTILFCDVAGSTALAEGLDPEEYTELMNGAFNYMIEPVYRYEGTLARLMGDAILAFFGAPLSHEDDPQRAVLAGLDIVAGIGPYCQQVKQRWGVEFNVRVGINTGLVVVGAVGSDLKVEYSALGDAINLAARMEQAAAPGTVQVAHETYRLVSDLFEFEALGSLAVKGKSEPVATWRVLGRKEQAVRRRGIQGLHAEMVGRQAELAALGQVLADLSHGVGRIVCVLGEAGLGKSRLVAEAHRAHSAAAGASVQWFETSSLSYETQQAYGLFQRLIRRVCGLGYNEPAARLQQALQGLAGELPPEQGRAALPVFSALFGLDGAAGPQPPLEGEAFRRALLEAMQAWWRSRFGRQPTVLVFDDMHWSDASSVGLLLDLLPLTGELPLVVLCALRAERQSPAWRVKTTADETHHHRYLEQSLSPLSNLESNELISRLLAVAELPEALRASIIEKSGGNPFFIEEVVRALIDSGAVVAEERPAPGGGRQRVWRASNREADIAIPTSLQSLLASRMDRLEEGTRGTLQVASVIGRSFYRRVLQAVDEASSQLDQHLSTLLQLEMIHETARLPEVEYAFRNPLTQEAVYETILLKRRRLFHQRVAEAIEALYADRLEGMLGLLAHHYTLAGQPERAIGYLRQAAGRALALYAYDDALANLRAALALAPPGERDDERRGLLEGLGDVHRLLRDGAQAIDHYEQALALAAEAATTGGATRSDDFSRPTARGEAAEAPAAGAAPGVYFTRPRLHRKIVEVVSEIKWAVSLDQMQQAGLSRQQSRAELEAALPALQAAGPNPEAVRALVALSTDAWRIEDPPDREAAQRYAEAAVRLAEQLHDSPADYALALGALATVLDGRSLLRQHLEVAQQRLALCHAANAEDVRERIEALRGAGAANMYVGEYRRGLPYLQEAEQLAAEARVVEQQANALGLQAQCWFRLDRWAEVFEVEQRWRALEASYPRERVGEMCFFVALSASAHALRGDMAQAEAYARESYEYMVTMTGAPDEWQRNQFY
jgi:class 3 adenylate cyclase/predicted ATPase